MKRILLALLEQFRNYCGLIKVARCGFPWEKTTKRALASVYTNCETALAVTLLVGLAAAAQNTAPEISFTSADTLKLPRDTYLGEVAGVATNSKGAVFVFTRTGSPSASLGGSRTFAISGGTKLFEDRKSVV